jgi:hypothetical protein
MRCRRKHLAALPLHHLSKPGASQGLYAAAGRSPTAMPPRDHTCHTPPPVESFTNHEEHYRQPQLPARSLDAG